jgi:hypothetical protein
MQVRGVRGVCAFSVCLQNPRRKKLLSSFYENRRTVHRYFCGAADRLLFVLEAHKVCPDSAAPSERRSRRARMTSS